MTSQGGFGGQEGAKHDIGSELGRVGRAAVLAGDRTCAGGVPKYGGKAKAGGVDAYIEGTPAVEGGNQEVGGKPVAQGTTASKGLDPPAGDTTQSGLPAIGGKPAADVKAKRAAVLKASRDANAGCLTFYKKLALQTRWAAGRDPSNGALGKVPNASTTALGNTSAPPPGQAEPRKHVVRHYKLTEAQHNALHVVYNEL